jgi:hypothetical protein
MFFFNKEMIFALIGAGLGRNIAEATAIDF